MSLKSFAINVFIMPHNPSEKTVTVIMLVVLEDELRPRDLIKRIENNWIIYAIIFSSSFQDPSLKCLLVPLLYQI